VSRIEAARLLRGRGGELMRATVCRWASFLSLLNHARALAKRAQECQPGRSSSRCI